jgi:hypothetical protein
MHDNQCGNGAGQSSPQSSGICQYADYARFSGFVGIDWSGAKAQFTPGIQLAMVMPGASAPRTVTPPKHRHWSRHDIFDFLLTHARVAPAGAPLLVGIDFAFAHPFADCNSYFPETAQAPNSAAGLWKLVDEVNKDMPYVYGGAMFRHPVWGAYYLAPPSFDAARYASRRRVTELAAKAAGRAPSPTFKAVGADNVCTGSMAGMRLLHNLRAALGHSLAIWPFDSVDASLDNLKMVLVEIFPSYYFYRVGLSPANGAAAYAPVLNKALAAYDSAGVDKDFVAKGRDADEADAIIAAAALRYFAQQTTSEGKTLFDLPDLLGKIARREGWIFGVESKYAPSTVF